MLTQPIPLGSQYSPNTDAVVPLHTMEAVCANVERLRVSGGWLYITDIGAATFVRDYFSTHRFDHQHREELRAALLDVGQGGAEQHGGNGGVAVEMRGAVAPSPALPICDNDGGGERRGGLDLGRDNLGGFLSHGARSFGDAAATSMTEPAPAAHT
jgi:hypothetical protein